MRPAALALAILVCAACDDETQIPTMLLQGRYVGTWELDDVNGSGGPVPDAFRRFELTSDVEGRLGSGVLIDADGRRRRYRVEMDRESFYGPWLVFPNDPTGTGFGDAIHLGCLAPIDDLEDFDLLVAFEKNADGSLYPHEYERVR